MNNVIINADDFGLNGSVNKAIVESFEKGLINSTTLMANMPGFDEAVQLAHDNKLVDSIGAHLVLTEGSPLTREVRVLPHLFNKETNSQKLFIKKFFLLNKSEKDLIFKEYSKQIEKIKNSGIPITHLDTHHQIHDMWGIMQVLVHLLKTYNIPSMRILNNLDITEFYKITYRNMVNSYLKSRKINFTDYLGSQVDFSKALYKNPEFTKTKSVEIMVHPAYNAAGTLIDILLKKEYELSVINPVD